ncbi:MAG TPA: hypothetical protein VFQ76_20960, partial [Longimicrobiaceae bacterium]|nr:hypothetical protein [Longimicrobiaceae bacterium]
AAWSASIARTAASACGWRTGRRSAPTAWWSRRGSRPSRRPAEVRDLPPEQASHVSEHRALSASSA